MLHMTAIRRLIVVGLAAGALAAVAPATSIASNPGGGHIQVGVSR
jgi:hypothetical protein